VLTLFATSIATIFVCSSLPSLHEGHSSNDDHATAVATALAPLNTGFMRMFGITYTAASILSIPATFATAFGFIFGYGRVILSMSRSGLFPAALTRTYGEYRTPYVAILVCSLLSYLMVILSYFVPIVQTYLFNVCIMAGYTGYTSQLVGFILFRIRHPDQERLFVSPLGIPGAVFGILIFTLSSISIMGFQDDNSLAFVIYLCVNIVATVYYFAYARCRQCFSPEENFIFTLQIVKCK
jgi:amino acid transporter